MDRVQAECRKCGDVFWTAAMTRTTCPGCKAAVTVRRDRDVGTYDGDEGEDEGRPGGGVALLAGVVIAIALGIWGGRGSQQ